MYAWPILPLEAVRTVRRQPVIPPLSPAVISLVNPLRQPHRLYRPVVRPLFFFQSRPVALFAFSITQTTNAWARCLRSLLRRCKNNDARGTSSISGGSRRMSNNTIHYTVRATAQESTNQLRRRTTPKAPPTRWDTAFGGLQALDGQLPESQGQEPAGAGFAAAQHKRKLTGDRSKTATIDTRSPKRATSATIMNTWPLAVLEYVSSLLLPTTVSVEVTSPDETYCISCSSVVAVRRKERRPLDHVYPEVLLSHLFCHTYIYIYICDRHDHPLIVLIGERLELSCHTILRKRI